MNRRKTIARVDARRDLRGMKSQKPRRDLTLDERAIFNAERDGIVCPMNFHKRAPGLSLFSVEIFPVLVSVCH